MTPKSDIQGFTLIEVLVAFSITALFMGTVFQVISGSLAGTRSSADRLHLVALAQSKLAQIGTEAPIAPGEWAGMLGDDIEWRTVVAVDEELVADRPDVPVVPYRIRLELRSTEEDGRKLLELETLRLGVRE